MTWGWPMSQALFTPPHLPCLLWLYPHETAASEFQLKVLLVGLLRWTTLSTRNETLPGRPPARGLPNFALECVPSPQLQSWTGRGHGVTETAKGGLILSPSLPLKETNKILNDKQLAILKSTRCHRPGGSLPPALLSARQSPPGLLTSFPLQQVLSWVRGLSPVR